MLLWAKVIFLEPMLIPIMRIDVDHLSFQPTPSRCRNLAWATLFLFLR